MKIIKKLETYLLMRNRPRIVERYIIMPIIKFLFFIQNYDVKKSKIKTILLKNKSILCVLSIVFTIVIISYNVGKSHSYEFVDFLEWKVNRLTNKVDYLNKDKVKKESTISQFISFFESKEWKRFEIYKESKILVPQNVKKENLVLMMSECDKYKIPYSIFFRLIQKESGFNHNSISCKGANGIMQIIPSTFTENYNKLNLKDGNTISNNIKVGAFILSQNYNYYSKKFDKNKSWELSLAAYNAGIGAVENAGNKVPDFKETKEYVAYVLNK